VTVSTALVKAAPTEDGRVPPARPSGLLHRLTPRSMRPVAGAVAVAAVAIFFYFRARSQLWLDETLSVNIARLPLSEIPGALRRDNSAPLHYLVLHVWMELFGTSNRAVRALSGVASLASLPFVWVTTRRLAGARAAWIAVLLFATSPFVALYATQARMYALVLLLTAAGSVALTSVLDRPTVLRCVALATTSGLLVLTHYWGLYLLAAVGAVLLAALIVTRRRVAVLCACAGIGAGSVLMLPWLPTFLFQAAHTGTPWGDSPTYGSVLDIPEYFADVNRSRWYLTMTTPAGRLLGLLFVALAGLAVLRARRAASAPDTGDVVRDRRPALALAGVVVGTVVLAVTASKVKAVSFESRYLSVVLVPFLTLVATGTALVVGRWLRLGVTVALIVLGAVGAAANAGLERSHAPQIAAVLNAAARPGDVVAYCPDQLAPPVDRLLRPGLQQVTFPEDSTPQRVNWVDYPARIRATDPSSYALDLVRRAGAKRDVWLVWGDGYRGFDGRCGGVAQALAALRPGPERPVVLPLSSTYFEPSQVLRFRAPS